MGAMWYPKLWVQGRWAHSHPSLTLSSKPEEMRVGWQEDAQTLSDHLYLYFYQDYAYCVLLIELFYWVCH